MAPRRAVIVGLWITALIGFMLAGYNGTAIWIWYTTGKVEILGELRDRAYSPFLYSKALGWDFAGFAVGAFLLVLVPLRLATFWNALRRRN